MPRSSIVFDARDWRTRQSSPGRERYYQADATLERALEVARGVPQAKVRRAEHVREQVGG